MQDKKIKQAITDEELGLVSGGIGTGTNSKTQNNEQNTNYAAKARSYNANTAAGLNTVNTTNTANTTNTTNTTNTVNTVNTVNTTNTI